MKQIQLVAFRKKDIEYFYSRINFGASALDAKAIRIMNKPILIDIMNMDVDDDQ